jgi:hypothetical protein
VKPTQAESWGSLLNFGTEVQLDHHYSLSKTQQVLLLLVALNLPRSLCRTPFFFNLLEHLKRFTNLNFTPYLVLRGRPLTELLSIMMLRNLGGLLLAKMMLTMLDVDADSC